MAVYNVSAGHNPDGKIACGTTGIIKESTEARYMTKKVIEYLKADGHTVYDCTCDNGVGKTGKEAQQDVLKKIVAKCNQHKVDLDVSIHFNDYSASSNGTEVHYVNSAVLQKADLICKNISSFGISNRKPKENTGLYFLNKTNSKALLIEVCFVNNKKDTDIYKANRDKIAKAIADGIQGKTYKPVNSNNKPQGEKDMKKLVTYFGDADVFGAVILSQKNACPLMKVSDYQKSGLKAETVLQVGGNPEDTNRYETLKNVAKQL